MSWRGARCEVRGVSRGGAAWNWRGGAPSAFDEASNAAREGACAPQRKKSRVIRQSLISAVASLLMSARLVSAQSSEDVPPLLEPLAEIPPTFWEQHGTLIMAGVLVLIALVGLLVWWLVQPKPVVPEPIEVRTRRELEALKRLPENGITLSKLSQCLRRYFTVAFELPPGEMTTTEFNRALTEKREKIGGELVAAVVDFFRRADEQKFSPAANSTGNNAAQQAMELFERAEKRRVELQQPVAAK